MSEPDFAEDTKDSRDFGPSWLVIGREIWKSSRIENSIRQVRYNNADIVVASSPLMDLYTPILSPTVPRAQSVMLAARCWERNHVMKQATQDYSDHSALYVGGCTRIYASVAGQVSNDFVTAHSSAGEVRSVKS